MANLWEAVVDEATATIRSRSRRPVIGCSDLELREFQAGHVVELPPSYLRYLGAAGKDCGDFLFGSDLHFDALDAVRISAQALLADDAGPTLPDDAFVFFSHQGYQFSYFRLAGGPDPEVYYYLEREGAFRVIAPSFSAWLVRAVADEFRDGR